MDYGTEIDALIRETRDLDARGGAIQGERVLEVEEEEIQELVDDYNGWYARALRVLPPEHHEKFIDLYEGGFVVKRIKAFLEAPGAVNAFFDEEQEAGLIPYWERPFESTFHSSLLEQQQVLTIAKQSLDVLASNEEIELVERIGRGLPKLIDSLRHRHDERSPLEVSDEYDVQDLLGGVLRALFEDVRPEDPSPTRAGGSSRVDFLLKRERIVVEVKMTRPGLRDRDIGNQLIEDIERYRSHPDCETLVATVFDPEHRVRNPRALEDDLRRDEPEFSVRIVVCR